MDQENIKYAAPSLKGSTPGEEHPFLGGEEKAWVYAIRSVWPVQRLRAQHRPGKRAKGRKFFLCLLTIRSVHFKKLNNRVIY
jgi:hypothetical protein